METRARGWTCIVNGMQVCDASNDWSGALQSNATAERLRFQHRVLAALTKNLAPPATGVTNLGKLKVTTTEAKSAAAQAEGDKDDDTGDGGDGDAKESPEGIACSSGEVFAPPV